MGNNGLNHNGENSRIVYAVAALLAIFVISPQVASAETPPPPVLAEKLLPPKAGDGAFDTPFYDATEAPITLNGLKGQGLVLNFWATWCLPCVEEMPSLDRLAAALKDSGVTVIAVSEDRKALEKIQPFFDEIGVRNLSVYYDDKGLLSRRLGVDGLPTTVLIDAEGREFGRVKGVLEWDDAIIEGFLRQTLAPPP